MRLDEWLVESKLFLTLKDADIAIQLGRVREKRTQSILDKPGTRVPKALEVEIEEEVRFVSRGGEKLEGFLKELGFLVRGLRALDVGSSTGGFSDCLLQNGAIEVTCVDVGTHQIHEKLRKDSRVRIFENTDIRNFDFSVLKDRKPELVVVDVSFISLRMILREIQRELPEAIFILLFKPQFELAKHIPKKRGVADPTSAREELKEMLQFLRDQGLNPLMFKDSALKGAKGNQETFIMTEPQIARHIFRTYDIRGHADTELPDRTAEKIGRAMGKRIVQKLGRGVKVGVGRDDRYSSPRIHSALSRGLLAEGAQVFDLGSITTPMAYFAHYNLGIDALFQITASHNPKDDNGMKMMVAKNTLFGDEIRSIADEAEAVFLPEINAENKSAEAPKLPSLHSELEKQYIEYLHSQIKLSRKYKIVLDCGNGMAGCNARKIFTPYASALEILYEKVDCTFPNHEADPTIPENLKDLQAKVKETGAEVGFAFDGDGDRLGVITKAGRILWGDEILMLLAELVLKTNQGATIIGEVKCSEKLFRMIEKKGGVPLMYKTGHSLIKKKMKEVGAPIAGEMSGHLFFADRYFGFDDAAYGALRVLEVMDKLNIDLDTWIAEYPSSFVTPEIRVVCEESEKEKLVKSVEDFFSKIPDAKLSLIDGVRVGFADGSWALVRASNTQAVLVVRIESISAERLDEIAALLRKALGRNIEIPSYV